LAEPLCEQVLAAARRYQVTIGTLCDAAWALVLHRRTARQTVAFGAIVAGRSAPFPEVEDVVGMCVAVIPRVVSFSPDASLQSWLGGMQRTAARDSEFEHVPETTLREALSTPSGPLFESVVLYENFPISGAEQSDADETRERPPGRDDKPFPLEVVITGRRRFVVELRHHLWAFDADDARELSSMFEHALAAVSDPTLEKMSETMSETMSDAAI
jgi:non-ribosomal peptide synthetase component F